MSEPHEPEDAAIKPDDGTITPRDTTADVGYVLTLAPHLFDEAVQESMSPQGDHNARRRQILSAFAFAETYLVEWVRDEVFKGDYQRFRNYYAEDLKEGKVFRQHGAAKFKGILKKLHEDKLIIPSLPDWVSTPYWNEFTKLVDYRNDLAHGSMSRPASDGMPKDEKPKLSPEKLRQLQPEWAIRVVVELIKELHRVSQTPLPIWLSLP